MGTQIHASVKFESVETRDGVFGKMICKVGSGVVVFKGNQKNALKAVRKAGGNRAGYFLYMTNANIGEYVS